MSKYEIVNKTGGIEIGGTTLYGMDAEHAMKQAAKYDYSRERDIIKWIEAALKEKLPSRDFHESLKSGVILCRLLNEIKPGTIKKFNTRSIALMEMENIKMYLEGCWKLGVPSSALFTSSDLYKQRGMNEVLNNLEALSKLAARMKTYTGPVLEIHERERSGSAGSSSSGGAAPKPSKWKKIEIATAPKYVYEGQSHEDVDIRSENFKLKQLLEREKSDREAIEEELAHIKKLGASSTTTTAVAAPVVKAGISAEEEQKWKTKVETLEKQIKELERTIATSSASRAQSAAQSDELYQIKKKLEEEKRLHETAKRNLERERETTTRLQQELTQLQSKVKSQSSVTSSVMNKLTGNNNNNNNNNNKQKEKDNQELTDLRSRYQSLEEETQILRELVKQLRSDLDFAVQVSSAPKEPRKTKNYFFIDATDAEASAEIKRVEDCLEAILASQDVEFTDVVELNQFFKADSGRRKFTQMLEKVLLEYSSLVLNQNSFELLLYLINTTLTEMDVSHSSDLITAKILMRAASIVSRGDDQPQFILDFITGYSVYHDVNFWEELFWDEVFRQHKQRSSASGMGEEDLYALDHNLTLVALENLMVLMNRWQSTQDEILRFAEYILTQTKTPDDYSSKLRKEMTSDQFWTELNSRQLKASFKRKPGRNTVRKKKTGSRVSTYSRTSPFAQ